MKFKNIIPVVIVLLVAMTSFQVKAHADSKVSMQNESIYDVLIDRFFDSDPKNNTQINDEKSLNFAGGDFAGITTKIQHFDDLDFTFLSIGSIAEAEDFRGERVVDYSKLQDNFGTKKQYEEMYAALHKINMKVMADFPINGVSEENTLIPSERKGFVIAGSEQGTVNWDFSNSEVESALIEAAKDYVKTYKLEGLRLTSIDGVNEEFLNKMIRELKKEQADLVIISDGPSDAQFDLQFDEQQMTAFQETLKNNNLYSTTLTNGVAKRNPERPTALMIDSLNSSRFTYFAAEENMFPPTRAKIALGVAMMLPGTPVMTYGTEISMNGKQPPESLQSMDFRTKDDIIKYVGQLQALRNGSEALRTGEYKELKNDNGFIVFERFNDDERWIIVVNNTDKTRSIDLSENFIGKNKELYGMFEKDIIRENDDSNYRVVLEREVVEVYQVKDKKGINIPYLVALGLVYVIFVAFLIAVLKRGKKKRLVNKEQEANDEK